MSARLLYQESPERPARVGDPAEILELRRDSGWVWLDLTGEAARVESISDDLDFDPHAVEDVLDIEMIPKYDDYGDHLYIVLHALIAGADDRVDTCELDVFITDRVIVTAHAEPLASIDAIWDATQRHRTALGCADPATVLARVSEQIGRRFLEVLIELETRIEDLDDRALDGDPSVLAQVQNLRHEESTVRTMVWPQRQVLASLRAEDSTLVSAAAKQRFGDAFDVHNQLVESLSAARGLLNDVLDTYRGASSEKLAEITRVLTVYAAILLPLSLITGFFGMNFDNLPLIHNRFGWFIVVIAMVVLSFGSGAWFTARGWIAGPSLRSASRELGRGLASVARRPPKPPSSTEVR